MPEVAVVIVNFRTSALAKRCALTALRERSVHTLLVIDNASRDGSVETLRTAGLEVHERHSNSGFAAAVNAGFSATSAPVVIVLNADVEPRPGALDRLVDHLDADRGVGVAAPRLVFPSGAPQVNGYRRFPGLATLALQLCLPLGYVLNHLPRLDPYRAPEDARAVAHVTGAALAIQRATYDDAGPFDEGYFLYLEETEWQQRVSDRGWRIERVPDAEVVHHMRGGSQAAEAPSPHFVSSARRYLVQRGHSTRVADAALGAGILCSRVGLRAVAAVVPAKREMSLRQAVAYERLWTTLRDERRGSASA